MRVVDTEAEEVTEDGERIRHGMSRRARRRQQRARTGHAQEKPISRMFWISLGAIVTVVTLRAFERYFPRAQQAVQPRPQPSLPPVPQTTSTGR